LQFCNNHGFVAVSYVTMLFCPLPHNLMLRRIGVYGKKRGHTVLGLIYAQSIMHIAFQVHLY